ncbi:Mucin-associated surface protein (MASP) [Trypanosoma cruzi]|uniref:Mucin-associated surface protein (MASP) n=1 Tax=Trypanosoma cruzi TaxID=5693 RepID=A0A2V2W6N4_TRYCR|nr:Mucin-associated surface protein (MASP) [Trypanosoma cruzi]
MAMMMTDRVLLVCALCVLWCGAGGICDEKAVGGCMASEVLGENGSNMPNGCDRTALMLSLRSVLPIIVAEVSGEEDGPSKGGSGGGGGVNPGGKDGGKDGAAGAPASGGGGNSSGSVSPGGGSPHHPGAGTVTSGNPLSRPQNASQTEVLRRDETENQSLSSPKGKAADTPVNGAQTKNPDNSVIALPDNLASKESSNKVKSESLTAPGAAPKPSPEGPNTELQGKGKASPELSDAKLPEPKTEHQTTTSEEGKNRSQNTSASTDSPAKQGRNNEDPVSTSGTAESTSTGSQEQAAATSSNESFSPLQEETSTETTNVENSRPSDTAQTEKRQNGGKEKAGDGDSSTAVSHSTSPLLLLLLVVACAAAAAVVAA